jgi:sterol desaturase/sphingolipid hydroxylase (fatty acid hydroxylase superfamily)
MVEFASALAVFVALGAAMLVLCILIEQAGLREPIGWRERVPGFAMNLVGSAATFLLTWPLGLLWNALGVPRLITLPVWQHVAPLGWLGTALHFLVLALLADFLAYWRHRFEHRVLWPIHAVHHSPRELHAANDIGHPLQVFANTLFISVPLSLVGVDGPAMPVALGLFIGALSIMIHSPARYHLGPLRRVVVDNRFHRIHHSLEERHFDKNFGICFSCWDHLFGTAYDPRGEWPAVGLSDVPAPQTIGDYLLIPFRPMGAAAEPRAATEPPPLVGTGVQVQ